MQYPRVQMTPFVPLYLPDGVHIDIPGILRILQNSSQYPLIIFLSHKKLEYYDLRQYPADFKFIQVTPAHLPDGPDFYYFKDLVFSFLKANPYGMIGICSAKRADLCGYFIVRWIIEERGKTVPEALQAYKNTCPPGISKKKYLKSLREIYEESVPSESLYQSFDETYASPDNNNLLKVVVPSQNLTRKNLSYYSNESTDSILNAVGSQLEPNEAKEISSTLRIFLTLNDNDFLVSPYYKFNSETSAKIKDDYNSSYMLMPEPYGRRCLLYLRGTKRYLASDGDFIRQVKVYFPEHETRSQELSSCILEGTLARESEESFRAKFFITDCHIIDGDDIRNKSFETRMNAIFSKVIRYRNEQKDKKLNPEKFQEDDISIEVRPYLRLKYIDSVFSDPTKFMTLPLRGLVFSSKSPPEYRSQISYLWQEDSQEYVTLRVKIVNDTKAEGLAKLLSGEETPVVSFAPVTEQLKSLNEKLVDIAVTDLSKNQWSIIGISDQNNPIWIDRFMEIREKPHLSQYGKEELLNDVHQIIQLPVYLEEERSKHHR